MLSAITRKPAPTIVDCELTHLGRSPIQYSKCLEEHESYVSTLVKLGLSVLELPPEPKYPDSVFVEDTAIVLDEVAIICRPGAESRLGESILMAKEIEKFRMVRFMEPPSRIDGGDVMVVNQTIYVGTNHRTNARAVSQLADFTKEWGYTVEPISFSGCLHLKTAVSWLGNNTLLLNPEWVDPTSFGAYDTIEVAKEEPFGANLLKLDDSFVYTRSHPKTSALLRERGWSLTLVDTGELSKAEAGLTCCSLTFHS